MGIRRVKAINWHEVVTLRYLGASSTADGISVFNAGVAGSLLEAVQDVDGLTPTTQRSAIIEFRDGTRWTWTEISDAIENCPPL